MLWASGTLSSAAASASFSMARQAGVVEHVLQTLQTPEAYSIRADPVLPSHVMVEQLLYSRSAAPSSRINGPKMLRGRNVFLSVHSHATIRMIASTSSTRLHFAMIQHNTLSQNIVTNVRADKAVG
ncbi:hypothetical protein EDM56_11330 [Brevibacillus fluminis]|uniref:Uncharacterized protein n=1 Tax=Brevibacillus fluminis TaxID=511487 RepID=A0A3M8DQP0_9BACL|nr:hypothetical protein [Brevibacillus fluminis]RNB89755.1 hypothetical protein EDM56_11330 [Brevibacillus fluminis]